MPLCRWACSTFSIARTISMQLTANKYERQKLVNWGGGTQGILLPTRGGKWPKGRAMTSKHKKQFHAPPYKGRGARGRGSSVNG